MGSLAAGWSGTGKRPLWYDIAGRFPEPRHCLASFLALEGAEVLEGVKPANLVNLPNRRRPFDCNLPSLEMAETFLCCRRQMARRLACCDDPLACLVDASRARPLFLSPANENDYQIRGVPCASH